ncbi:MAG: CsiV family protein [Pseudomonadales bacterium]
MKLHSLRTFYPLALIVTLLATTSTAADETEPRWFSIELIVFEQFLNPSYAENWPAIPELNYPDNLVRFPSESRHNSQPELFTELPFEGHLQTPKAKLKRARGQRVVFSRRWEQGLLGKDDAPYIYIRGGERSGKHRELEGSIQVSVERYLHIRMNLWLSKFADELEMKAIGETQMQDGKMQDLSPSIEVELEQEPFLLPELPFRSTSNFGPHAPLESVFLLKQERRLRSRETHYIDHPAMGIVLRIEPLPERSSAPGSP